MSDDLVVQYTELMESSVDLANLKGIALLGNISKNGRVYPEDVMRKAVAEGKFEGAPITMDFGLGQHKPGTMTNVAAVIGKVVNTIYDEAAKVVRGDFELFEQFKEQIVSLVNMFPEGRFGISPILDTGVDTRTFSRDAQNRSIVPSIAAVQRLDIVSGPATLSGFSEQVEAQNQANEQIAALKQQLAESQKVAEQAELAIKLRDLCLAESAIPALAELVLKSANLEQAKTLIAEQKATKPVQATPEPPQPKHKLTVDDVIRISRS